MTDSTSYTVTPTRDGAEIAPDPAASMHMLKTMAWQLAGDHRLMFDFANLGDLLLTLDGRPAREVDPEITECITELSTRLLSALGGTLPPVAVPAEEAARLAGELTGAVGAVIAKYLAEHRVPRYVARNLRRRS